MLAESNDHDYSRPGVASGSPIVGPIVIVALNFALCTVLLLPLSFLLRFFFNRRARFRQFSTLFTDVSSPGRLALANYRRFSFYGSIAEW